MQLKLDAKYDTNIRINLVLNDKIYYLVYFKFYVILISLFFHIHT